MITNVQPAIFSFLVAALAQDQPKPDAEKAAKLRDELLGDPEGRGYADQPAEIVHMLLHGEYSKAVPERWEVKTVVTGAEIKNWIAPLKLVLRQSTASAEDKAEWLDVLGDWQGVDASYSFDPLTSATWMGLTAQAAKLLDASGQRIITAEAIRALTHTLIPERVEMARPRIEQLLGPGIVLSLEDVQGVM
jgi:hypothetical protein